MRGTLAIALAMLLACSWAAAAENGTNGDAGGKAIEQLGWLVGDWIDEGPEMVVVSNYRWSADHRAILGEYRVRGSGRDTLAGTLRIAWDPALKKVHSWVFDSQGGFSQGIWTRDGNAWILKTTGTTGDGQRSSATAIATREGNDRVVWQVSDQTVGEDVLPQQDAVHMVRTPPRPSP